MSGSEVQTGTTGQYSFTGLRAGNYTVEISGFDDEDVGFGATTASADLDVGESQVVTFEGTYLRASSIMGQVGIEGTGLADVTVSLQGKGETREMQTNSAGQYLFEDLRRGDYAIGISGFDDDEYGFDVTSKSVHVPYGETENVPFEGIALRTAEIRGVVEVDGMGPLEGVTVSLTGKGDDPDPVVTMGDGRFSFDRLHAGDYTISIFGYDTDEYGFDVTSQNVTVALKETATLEFDGILLRTAAIEGMVTVKGDGLKDVTVTVAGGPKDEEHEAMTNSAGMFDVGDLHAGDYSVTISGYDTKEYGFEVTTKSVSVGLRETAEVAFDGILLRTAGVSGRVTIDGEPMSGLTVTLAGEEARSGMTTSDGQYAFSGLAAGDYTLTLSGYDADEYEFNPSMMNIELELDEAAIANFMGRSLRTVVIMGTVSAEGDALMNVGVTLIKVLGATTGEVLGAMMTDSAGGYMFDELLAGVYRIELGETDDEYDFATKSQMGSVATDETAMWDFDATIIRTASVGGMVTVDGDPMGDVMVMLTGDHDTDMEMETDSDGMYMFDGLRKGDYTVSIMNPDEDMYDFPTTERMVSLAVGQAQTAISFAGSMNRRASISGQVHVEGDGIEGVTVKLRGEERADTETDGNGEYNFPGLAGGDYTVSIENPDADAYIFDVMSVDVDSLGDETAEIVDFAGEHTTTASVSGMLFADEVKVDSMYTDGEPALKFPNFPLLLQGPGLDDATIGATDTAGMYSFDSLKAGKYNLVINITPQLKAAMDRAGYAFSGSTIVSPITVPAAMDVDVNLPFRITKQTIHASARLATNDSTGLRVGGVSMALYPTAEDAQDGTNSLGAATTRSSGDHMGVATFEFERAKDRGPGGTPIDYLVYAKVTRVGNPDLHVHSDDIIEIEYEAVDRESRAPTAVKLINTRVNFQWWVKSNETAKDGNQDLGGWKATNGMTTNSSGLATYTGTLSASQIAAAVRGVPARFTVAMNTSQHDSVDGGEKWEALPRSLRYTHDGLENPATNTAANNDLGPIYITWQTHSLVLGVYRETDDMEGYTNYQSRVPGGDQRPVSSVGRGMKVEFLAEDSRGRDKPYKYDRNGCKPNSKPDSVEVNRTFPASGLITVSCLPRNDEFTIKFTPDTASAPNRVEVGIVAEKLRGYLEPYNEDDMSLSGSTVGTFGDRSGGVHEVRICLSSDESLSKKEATSDEKCATWAYQWTTGSVIGAVRNPQRERVGGHRILIEPTEDADDHGAKVDSAKSSSSRDYEIDGLRDGVYNITAHSTRTHKIRGDSVHEVFFYHDEKTDDKDTATKYVGTAVQDTADWTVQRLGLRIMGYIGHDSGSRDKKFRGDETVAGITVRLSGGEVSMTTRTDEHGFYRFDSLPEGTYTIRPSPTSHLVFRGYLISGARRTAYTSWSARAQENYPSSAKPTEGTVSLPYVSSYTRRTVTNSTSQYCNDGRTKCGTLYNFGLLYKDGEIETTVHNLSPGTADIKLIFTDVFKNSKEDVRGGFKRTHRDEGDYRVTIDDANWARPRMRGSVPDDDGTTLAPATVTKSLRGKDDFESITLHVYDAGASSDDGIRSSRVTAYIHGNGVENFDSLVRWSPAWKKASGTEKTNDPTVFGPISWKSPVVTFAIVDATGAKFEVKKGSTVCASHRCMLDDWNTGHSREGEARENTITVTVTAPNGYDDHEYGMKVTRAAPVGNELTREHFRRVDVVDGEEEEPDHALGDGDGKTVARAFTLETKEPSDRWMNMRIDLMELGVPGEPNEYCAQRVVMVKEYNDDDDDALDALNPADDEDKYEDDVCRDTRYRLERDKLYEIEIESEDSVDETYYLNTRNRDRSRDAGLVSLEVDEVAVTLRHPSGNADTAFMRVVETPDTVIVKWETTENATSTPREPGEDGYKFVLPEAPNAEDTLAIRVVSEDKSDTAHYGLVVQRANNVATLATLTGVTLDPEFAPTTTTYRANVAHDVATATFTYTTTDPDATATQNPANPVALAERSTTTVSIVSTAEDNDSSITYTVAVTRAAPPADPTAGVVLMEVDSVTPFSEEITEGATDTIQVTLAVEPTADSTVTVNITAGTGLTPTPGSMTFTSANWEDEQELVVVATSDEDAEENDPVDLIFSMNGDAGNGYGDATSADNPEVDTVAVAIDETDTKGVNLSATAKQVNEAVAGTYTVELNSQPVGGNVNIEISGAPDEVTMSATQLTFTPDTWDDAQTVTITPTQNTDTAEWDEFTLSHRALGGGYTDFDIDDVGIQVLDDEAPQVVVSTTGVTVNEGGSFTYTISLTQAPSSGETVTVDLNFNTGELTASETTVTFNSDDTDEEITITARNVTADFEVRMIHYTVSVEDTDTGDGSETVYADNTTATSTAVTVKNVPE